MRIGFIGAGNVTKTFGRHLIEAGHEIIVSNSRGPETLAGLVADLGPGATAGTKAQAAESDLVILATMGERARGAKEYRLAWADPDRCDQCSHGYRSRYQS